MSKTKNSLEKLAAKLTTALPKATVAVKRPLKTTGAGFLDASLGSHSVTIQWKQRLGFATPDDDLQYGEHPRVVITKPEEAAARAIDLLRGKPMKESVPEALTLAELRERFFLSQKELAARLGIKQASVSAFETNTAKSKLETLRKLARALGATLEVRFLLPGRDPVTLSVGGPPAKKIAFSK